MGGVPEGLYGLFVEGEEYLRLGALLSAGCHRVLWGECGYVDYEYRFGSIIILLRICYNQQK